MSDERWNRFAATGSVRDYLEYRACTRETGAAGECLMREEKEHGADDLAERNGSLCDACRGL